MMRKFLSVLLACVIATSLFAMPVLADDKAPDVNPNWQYKVMLDFEELNPGFEFGGKDDEGYSLYLKDATKFGGRVGKNGYKGSNTFELYSKADKSGYAQPLINTLGFNEKNTEFEGATEFWMWVDFSSIKFDGVGLQFRIIEDDIKADGTPSGALSQWSPAKDKPIYIQSSPTTWKTLKITNENKIPVENMEGYKGFIRIPISSFYAHDAGVDENGKFDLVNVIQLWFIFNFPNHNSQEYMSVDQIMFVGPSLNDGKPISRISLTDTNQKGESTTKAATATTTTASVTTTTVAATETTTTEETTVTEATTTTSAPTQTEDTGGNQTQSNLIWLWIVLAVVVLGGAGAAVWYFVIKKKQIE